MNKVHVRRRLKRGLCFLCDEKLDLMHINKQFRVKIAKIEEVLIEELEEQSDKHAMLVEEETLELFMNSITI